MKIEIAQTAKYMDQYNRWTHRVEFVTEQLLSRIKEDFEISDFTKILIRPIRSMRIGPVYGKAYRDKVELDCRVSNVWGYRGYPSTRIYPRRTEANWSTYLSKWY